MGPEKHEDMERKGTVRMSSNHILEDTARVKEEPEVTWHHSSIDPLGGKPERVESLFCRLECCGLPTFPHMEQQRALVHIFYGCWVVGGRGTRVPFHNQIFREITKERLVT
jgi:hypothetical protein